ncbi:MAG: putative toxin-antitoxin system toxin component, PIN family [Nanoarchaeota archaeon]
MRVVLDTNIFVSGIHWSGASSKVIEGLLKGKFESVTSDEILLEFLETMRSFKIPMSDDSIAWWENLIISKSEIVLPKEKLNVVKNDPDDDKFIEAAVEGDCDCIVSKDKKHLLKLKEFRGIKIISPEEFLKLL